MQLNLFETPAEKTIRELPEELREVYELAKCRWGGDRASRGAWINYLRLCGAVQPEDAFEGLLGAGVIEEAGQDQYRMEGK